MATNNAPHINGRLRAPKGGLRHNGKTYRAGALLPAHYKKESARPRDPASGIDEAPPNFGRFSMPHVITFQGLMSTISKVYRNPDEAIKNSRENALKMRRDCFIMECLEARQRGTALLNWHLEPEDKDSLDQKELCDQLTKILQDIPRFTEYRRNLLEALWFGRYGIQHQYGFDRRYSWKRTLIKGWLPVHGDKLAFRYDDGTGEYDENQIGIRVIGHYSIGDKIAGDRKLEPTDFGLAYFLQPWERTMFAIHKHMIEDAAFEDITTAGSIHGVGIRSRIYWTWYQMQEALAMLIEYLERTGMGFTIYWFPAGNDQAKEEMRQVAFERSESNVILMPRTPGDPAMDGYGIERIEPNPAGAESLKTIVHEFFGHRIKRYILGQTLTTESQPLGLGGGAADVQYDSLLSIVEYDASNVEETITKETVEPLKNWTFPAARDIPVRFKIDTESHEAEKKLQAYQSAWDMGCKIKASDVYNVIGAAAPTEDDEVLINPSIAQQARLWEQQHGQQAKGNQSMGASLPTDAQPGSIEDLFGPLANLGAEEESGGNDQRIPAHYSARVSTLRRQLLRIRGNEQLKSKLESELLRLQYRREGDGGLPSIGDASGHRTGETKVINGKTYRLNEHSRWERTDDDEAGGDQTQGQPDAPPRQPPVPDAAGQGPSLQERQQHAAKNLSSIDKHVASMFRAFHASPEYQQGGEYWTQQFAPQQAETMHKQLSANAGKDFGGGRVVDLGERIPGAIGFSSAAGAMVVAPPKEPGGQWRVSYTVMTGPVKRSMEGGEALPQGGEQQESTAGEQQTQDATGGPPSVEGVEPEAAPAPQAPPQIPTEWLKKQHDSIADQAKQHQANIASMTRRKDELLSTGDVTDKKMAAQLGRQLVAERARLRLKQGDLKEAKEHLISAEEAEKQAAQAKAAKGTETGSQPSTSPTATGPKFHEMTREEFAQAGHGQPQHHKQHLKEALGRGERISAHILKDYPELILAAARQADRKKEATAEQATTAQSSQQPTTADSPKPKAEPAPLSPEQQAKKRISELIGDRTLHSTGLLSAGHAAPSMRNMNLLREAVGSGKIPDKETLSKVLDESRRLAEAGDTSGNFEKALKSVTEGEGNKLPGGVGDETKASDVSPDQLAAGVKVEQEHTGDPAVAQEIAKDHLTEDPNYYDKLRQMEAQPKEPDYSATERYNIQSVLGQSGGEKHLTEAGLQPHGRNQAALRQAVASGHIADSKHLGSVLKTAAKLKNRGDLKADDHQHVKEAIRRHVERQLNKVDLGAIVEERAAEAQVAPADLHEAIKHVHGFRSESTKARENAKAAIRQQLGLNARRIAQLENQGKDYSHVKGFDDSLRSIQGEHPELGIRNEQDLWRLLKEGAERAPARHDDVIIEEALAFLKLNKSKAMSQAERDELESVPFKKFRELWARYSKEKADGSMALTYDEFVTAELSKYARYKPGEGQRGLWTEADEKKHPRNEDGEWTEKDSDEVLTSRPDSDTVTANQPPQAGSDEPAAKAEEGKMTETKQSYEEIREQAKAENWGNKKIKQALYEAGIAHRRDEMLAELGREKGPSNEEKNPPEPKPQQREKTSAEKIAEYTAVEGPAKIKKEKNRIYLEGVPRGHIAAKDLDGVHWDSDRGAWWLGSGEIAHLRLARIAADINGGKYVEAEKQRTAEREFKQAQHQAEIGLQKNVEPHWPTYKKVLALTAKVADYHDAVRYRDVKDAQFLQQSMDELADLANELDLDEESSTADIARKALKGAKLTDQQAKALATGMAKAATLAGFGTHPEVRQGVNPPPSRPQSIKIGERSDKPHVTLSISGSKKAGEKPYLAKIGPGFSREFIEGHKETGTEKGFTADLKVGDVVEWRAHRWDSDAKAYVGGRRLGVVVNGGIVLVDRKAAEAALRGDDEIVIDEGTEAIRLNEKLLSHLQDFGDSGVRVWSPKE